jgi:hypothetical protein
MSERRLGKHVIFLDDVEAAKVAEVNDSQVDRPREI